MSIIDNLITDRSQLDVDALRALLARGEANWTAEELAEFNLARSKGSYNYTDLNRVTQAMDYLNERLAGYGYQTGYQKVEVPHQQSVSPLPDGYTQLEYIESSGTQYVDTGFKANQDTRVVMDFELLAVAAQYADPIFGSRTSASANGYYFWCSGTVVSTEQYQSGYNNGSTYPAVTRVGRHTVDKNKNVTTVDGVTTEAAYAAFTTAWNMLLFQSYNNGNLYSQTTKMRLYSCQTYDNDTLIRDYIPCKTPGGDIGLYDLVTQEFYGNAGTGTFTAGPDVEVEPEEEEELDPYTWYESDIPTVSLMTAYLSNVQAIRSTLEVMSTTPETPESMEALTWVGANNIEQILLDIDRLLTNIFATWVYSGDVFSGEAQV